MGSFFYVRRGYDVVCVETKNTHVLKRGINNEFFKKKRRNMQKKRFCIISYYFLLFFIIFYYFLLMHLHFLFYAYIGVSIPLYDHTYFLLSILSNMPRLYADEKRRPSCCGDVKLTN